MPTTDLFNLDTFIPTAEVSRLAWESYRNSEKHIAVKQKIVLALDMYGPMTYRELEAKIQHPGAQKRLRELVRENKIIERGCRHCDVTNKLLTVWAIIPDEFKHDENGQYNLF